MNKNVSIEKLYNGLYLYCDASDNLILFNNESHTHNILYNQVDVILFCKWNNRGSGVNVIYKKMDTIIYSLYSCLKNIDTYTTNYCGSSIVKILDIGFFLDADNNLYVFTC